MKRLVTRRTNLLFAVVGLCLSCATLLHWAAVTVITTPWILPTTSKTLSHPFDDASLA